MCRDGHLDVSSRPAETFHAVGAGATEYCSVLRLTTDMCTSARSNAHAEI